MAEPPTGMSAAPGMIMPGVGREWKYSRRAKRPPVTVVIAPNTIHRAKLRRAGCCVPVSSVVSGMAKLYRINSAGSRLLIRGAVAARQVELHGRRDDKRKHHRDQNAAD